MVVRKLLFAVIMSLVRGNLNTTTIWDRIPDLMKIYCPGRDVCGSRSTAQNTQPAESVCCTDCSCEPTCSLEFNCCYNDTFNAMDESIDVRGNQDGLSSECLFPLVQKEELSSWEEPRYQSYKMITKTSKDETCGERKVAPWGSLYPVSSKISGRIYKNIKCAENSEYGNVTDGESFEPWRGYLICSEKYVTRYMLGLENGSVDSDCQLRFAPPRDDTVSRAYICYRNLIKTCPNKTFNIPDRMTETHQEIIAACQSGLLSPFRKSALYANVFCFICSGNRFRTDGYCETLLPVGQRSGFRLDGYIGLLDGTFLQNAKELWQEEHISETVCLDTEQKKRDGNCKTVHCPSGQLHDSTGKCKYPMEEWIIPKVKVCLKLTSEIPFAIEQLRGAISRLMSPWPKPWFFENIFTEVSDDDQQSKVILINMANVQPQRNPYILQRTVKRLMSKRWTLGINNETFIADFCSATLRRLDYRSPYWFPSYHQYKTLENLTLNVFVQIYEKNDLDRQEALYITKLHLCKQIRLFPSEFKSMTPYDKALYINISNRYLLNNEFVLLDIEGQTVAQVCIEDSGFIEAGVGTVGSMVSATVRHIYLPTFAFLISKYS